LKALDYAEETAETESREWRVTAVSFAAIRDDRFVRMCLELDSASDTAETELSIDLQEITQQLNNQDGVIGGLEDGVNAESSLCSLELEDGEKRVPVSVVYSDAHDIVDALQALDQAQADELGVSLLHHGTGSYLVFGAPDGVYEGLDMHAVGTYTEIKKHYGASIFILLPLAIAFDAVIIAVMIILLIPCAIPLLLPLCIPIAIVTGKGEIFNPELYEGGGASSEEEDLFE
jgi:hypothetical protein